MQIKLKQLEILRTELSKIANEGNVYFKAIQDASIASIHLQEWKTSLENGTKRKQVLHDLINSINEKISTLTVELNATSILHRAKIKRIKANIDKNTKTLASLNEFNDENEKHLQYLRHNICAEQQTADLLDENFDRYIESAKKYNEKLEEINNLTGLSLPLVVVKFMTPTQHTAYLYAYSLNGIITKMKESVTETENNSESENE